MVSLLPGLLHSPIGSLSVGGGPAPGVSALGSAHLASVSEAAHPPPPRPPVSRHRPALLRPSTPAGPWRQRWERGLVFIPTHPRLRARHPAQAPSCGLSPGGDLCLQPTSDCRARYSQPLALARAWPQPGEAREGLRTVQTPLLRPAPAPHGPAAQASPPPPSLEAGALLLKRQHVRGAARELSDVWWEGLGNTGCCHYCFLLWETDLCLRGAFKVRPERATPSGDCRPAGHKSQGQRSQDKVTGHRGQPGLFPFTLPISSSPYPSLTHMLSSPH